MNPWTLTSAFGLDLILGDPAWLPHPVRAIGRSVELLECGLRRIVVSSLGERAAGLILTLSIVLLSYVLSDALIALAHAMDPVLGIVLSLYLSCTVLATKSLGDESRAVLKRLESNDLNGARRQLSRIVGRDTEQLSESEVVRATVETVAESTSDGIIAPLFYLAIGGPPLAMAYKAINTLDSMVGYKTARYRDFGWASARLDDLANYLPARISGCLMVLAASLRFRRGRQALEMLIRDGRKHDSPNAGIPEAATAGALGIQLGGPSRYAGVLKEKPWLGCAEQAVQALHIQESLRLMRCVSCLMLIFSLLISYGA